MSEDEEPDIDALLRYDPMAEGSGEGPTDDGSSLDEGSQAEGAGGQGQGSETEGGQQSGDSAGADDGSQSQQTSDESGEPASGGKSTEDLEEQVRQLQAQLQQMQKQSQGQGQSGQQQEEGEQSQDELGEIPDYQFQIPEKITKAIGSEDENERAQGLNALVAGIGQAVHSRVREEYKQLLDKRVKEVEQRQAQAQEQEQTETQADQIRKDYFGKFPHHDSKVIKPIVRQVSDEVMQEFNAATWTPKIRDEIGKRVDKELRNAGFQQGSDHGQAQQPSKGNGADGQQQPPHMRRGNSRPSGGGAQSDIESTLFG